MPLKEVDVKSLNISPFTAIGDDWMLVTAGDQDSHNTMTASWGGLGVLWGAPVATCYIRQSRYTKEFVDASQTFTLSFLDPARYRRELGYLGRVSGRDEDKIAACGLSRRLPWTAPPRLPRRASPWSAARPTPPTWARRALCPAWWTKSGGTPTGTTTPCTSHTSSTPTWRSREGQGPS